MGTTDATHACELGSVGLGEVPAGRKNLPGARGGLREPAAWCRYQPSRNPSTRWVFSPPTSLHLIFLILFVPLQRIINFSGINSRFFNNFGRGGREGKLKCSERRKRLIKCFASWQRHSF